MRQIAPGVGRGALSRGRHDQAGALEFQQPVAARHVLGLTVRATPIPPSAKFARQPRAIPKGIFGQQSPGQYERLRGRNLRADFRIFQFFGEGHVESHDRDDDRIKTMSPAKNDVFSFFFATIL